MNDLHKEAQRCVEEEERNITRLDEYKIRMGKYKNKHELDCTDPQELPYGEDVDWYQAIDTAMEGKTNSF